jgi:hypothetical protein
MESPSSDGDGPASILVARRPVRSTGSLRADSSRFGVEPLDQPPGGDLPVRVGDDPLDLLLLSGGFSTSSPVTRSP